MGKNWHTCPVCGIRFQGTSHKKFCSPACKQKVHRTIHGDYHKPRDESIAAYRNALAREWFNPQPWAGKTDDSPIYGNMVFL